jgi:hypothetical protein
MLKKDGKLLIRLYLPRLHDLPMQSAQSPTQNAYEPMQHAAYAPMQHVTEIADLKVRLELVIADIMSFFPPEMTVWRRRHIG